MRLLPYLLLAACAASPARGNDSYVLPDGLSRAPGVTLHCVTQGMNAAPCGTAANPVPITSQAVGAPKVGPVTSVGTAPAIVLPALGNAATRRYFFHIWNFGSANLYCTDDGSTQPSAISASFIVYANGGGYEKDAPEFVSNQALNCVAGAGSVPVRVESLP